MNEAIRLIQYINELSQLKQKPIASFKKYDEVLWVSKLPEGSECQDAFISKTDDWLYVRKPVHPVVPVIPTALRKWITIDYKEYSITIHKSITEENSTDESTKETVLFIKDFPNIEKQINQFQQDSWNPYVTEAARVKEIQDLYDKLFKMYQNLQLYSESLELVVSTGFLQWNNKSKDKVERHLLTSEAELQFNRERGEFIILPTSKGKVFEYEEDMLLVENRLTGQDGKDIQNLLLELEADEKLIPNMSSILQRIAHALDSQGNYISEIVIPNVHSENPTVSLSPAFVLRKKTQKSFQKACETAVEQLENITDDSQIPGNILNMFSYSTEKNTETEELDSSFKEAQEFYFPLPSNEEQNRIISTLNNRSSVLVQGPPGTGKTHTIANLTSHLLSTGQRVLITSQTAKALSVLKSKLPEELQDLSVSLLGGDSASMKDLEKVVNTISINKERFDLKEMTSQVGKDETVLKGFKSDLNKTKTELMEIRESETYKHNFNTTYSGTAQQIAEKVNEYAPLYDWYTTNVTPDTPENFWENEKSLISEYIRISKVDMEVPDGYKAFEYPSINADIDLKIIPDLIIEEKQLHKSYDSIKANELEKLQSSIKNITGEKLITLKNEFHKLKDLQRTLLFNSYPSLKKVIADIFTNRGFVWEEIIQKSSQHLQIIKSHQGKFDEQLVTSGNLTTAVLKKMAEDLHKHLADGGSMGNFFFKPKTVKQYKEQLQQVTYNGIELKSQDQLNSFLAYAQSRYAKEEIQNILIPTFLSEDAINPISAFSEVQNAISQLSDALLIEKWRNNLLEQNSFLTRDTFNEDIAEAFSENLDIYQIKEKIKEKTTTIESVTNNLESKVTEQSHPLYKEMIDSIKNRSLQHFNKKLSDYNHFQEVMQRDNTLNTIFSKLGKESPSLANSLEEYYSNPEWEQRLNTWQKAFEWKQTKNWIGQFSMKSESSLSNQYNQIESKIKETIIKIGTAKAWINMLRSMTDTQSKHLKAWAKSVKSIGKGTGKNAARYRADAQKHMEQCIDAIPAWIMPLNQVYDNFEIRPNLFDVVIIDEASQSWHDALLLKYLAKKLIIVGDDKQISPTIIGITDEDILKLQNKYFKDINFPFGRDLNLKTSFFDISYIMFKDTITLREHFRCMPEIIGFSNLISYRDKPLIPLRQYPANRLEPLKSVYLPHGVREGTASTSSNKVEADRIVQEIKSCIENLKYDGKTFGVISLLGENQAKLIQNKLLSELGAEIMEERKIICGDAYAFQGDERDIIFLSMVVANGATRVTAMADDKARQRFNVAASRAKDQLWLVHSITVNDISNRDCLRYQLLSYFANPLKEETESNRVKCESNFEKHVFDDITSRGYRVIPQYNAANYRIDLVVQGEKSKLAVECDGDHWHTSVEDRERDFLRERVLQRAGWTFWRVLGSTYYNNPQKALESLWEKIEEMDIRPYLEWHEESLVEEVAAENTIGTDSKQPDTTLLMENHEMDFLTDTTKQVEYETDQEPELAEPIKPIPETNDQKPVQPNQIVQPSLFTEDKPITDEPMQLDLFGETEILHYKKRLEHEGYFVLTFEKEPSRLYILGDEQISNELNSIAPKDNPFSFLRNGNAYSQGEPVWYLDFNVLPVSLATDEEKKNLSNQEILNKDKADNPRSSKSDSGLFSPSKINEQNTPIDNPKYEHYKQLLRHEGFEVMQDQPRSNTLYVVGTESIRKELEYLSPKGNSFSFHKNGLAISDEIPVWSITFDNLQSKQISKVEETKKISSTGEMESIRPTEETPEFLLKELKQAGHKIIDNRSMTETIWIIGGEELAPVIESFKKHRVIFRYLEKGHSLTHYKPTWFARMKIPIKSK